MANVEMLVLDEADRMLDMGFIDDVEFISDVMPEGCQTLLFAATMNDVTTRLARKFMTNPDRVEIEAGTITHDKIEQRLHMTDSLQHKNRLLRHLCSDEAVTRAIIFSATKRETESLARDLNANGYAAAPLHADMTQSARNRTMADMRQGKIRLLVATDVAARGIDVTGISHVINFDLPRSAEDYVNRIGRTGRAEESGIAISLASRADLPQLERIQHYIGQILTTSVIPGLEPGSRQPRKPDDVKQGRKQGEARRSGGRNRRPEDSEQNRNLGDSEQGAKPEDGAQSRKQGEARRSGGRNRKPEGSEQSRNLGDSEQSAKLDDGRQSGVQNRKPEDIKPSKLEDGRQNGARNRKPILQGIEKSAQFKAVTGRRKVRPLHLNLNR